MLCSAFACCRIRSQLTVFPFVQCGQQNPGAGGGRYESGVDPSWRGTRSLKDCAAGTSLNRDIVARRSLKGTWWQVRRWVSKPVTGTAVLQRVQTINFSLAINVM
jgi:hypothetical protein